MIFYPYPYIPGDLISIIEDITDREMNLISWNYINNDSVITHKILKIRHMRDLELLLDLTGNIDSCV